MVAKMQSLIGGTFQNKEIAILGLAFKANTDDIRESPSLEMIDAIIKDGGVIRAFDPIANKNMKKIYPDLKYYDSWELACKNADAVAIMTEWNEFRGMDLSLLKSVLKTPIVLDTRNLLSPNKLQELNFIYDNVGRKINS